MTLSIELTIHGTGVGQCTLSGKEGEGIIVTFKDGTLREGFLSYKAFQQLIKMKAAQGGKPVVVAAQPVAQAVPVPSGNGASK